MSYRKIFLVTALLLIAASVFTLTGYAQEATNNFVDPFIAQYADNAAAWEAPLKAFAQNIFWLLALIEIVWVIKDLAIGQASFEDWALAVLQQLVVIGFFWAMLTHSSEWAKAIIDSFKIAGNTANLAAGGVPAMSPSNVFDAGMNIASTCVQAFDWGKLGDSLAIVLSAIVICISYALMAGLLAITLVESYIFTYAGIIFLGFGGSGITRHISKQYLQGMVAIGAKLMVIQLIVGLGVTMTHQWQAQIAADASLINLKLLFNILGGSIIFLALTKAIPETVQGMLTGSSATSIGGMVSSAMAMGSITQAMGQGVASGIAGAFGQDALSERLGQGSANHAQEAFRHSTGEYAMSNQQSMPAWFQDSKPKGENGTQKSEGGSFRYDSKSKNTISGEN
jgi:type IV secretion system protein TrbL